MGLLANSSVPPIVPMSFCLRIPPTKCWRGENRNFSGRRSVDWRALAVLLEVTVHFNQSGFVQGDVGWILPVIHKSFFGGCLFFFPPGVFGALKVGHIGWSFTWPWEVGFGMSPSYSHVVSGKVGKLQKPSSFPVAGWSDATQISLYLNTMVLHLIGADTVPCIISEGWLTHLFWVLGLEKSLSALSIPRLGGEILSLRCFLSASGASESMEKNNPKR